MWRNSSKPLFFIHRSIILNGLSACEEESVRMPIETKFGSEKRKEEEDITRSGRIDWFSFSSNIDLFFPFWRKEKREKIQSFKIFCPLVKDAFSSTWESNEVRGKTSYVHEQWVSTAILLLTSSCRKKRIFFLPLSLPRFYQYNLRISII